MRITQQMLSQMALNGMQTNLQRLSKLQQQASSTKRISQPSDDPAGTERALSLRSEIKNAQTLLDSLGATGEWLDATSTALGSMGDLLSDVHTKALTGANETMGEDERASLAATIDGYLEEAIGLANTRYGDEYVFSGFKVDAAPFEVTRDPVTDQITGITYVGDDGAIVREIEPGTDAAINVVGEEIFGDAVATLIQLRDALQTDPFIVDDVSATLTEIKDRMNEFLDEQARVGAQISRVENTTTRLETSQINLRELLSSTEDADMSEVLVQLTQQQYAYQAALNVTGSVLQMSLLDFLD